MPACRIALRRCARIACVLGTAVAGVGAAAGPEVDAGFEVVHVFAERAEGRDPEQALVQAADGLLFGTARGGGRGAGTLFRVGPGGEFGLAHAFRADGVQGVDPAAPVMPASDGALYGTTRAGGREGFGTLYRLRAGRLEVLHDFSAADDIGFDVRGALVEAADGALYGVAGAGGPSGLGTVFRLGPSGALECVHAFDAAADDGWNPAAGLARARDGTLYGTTEQGGRHGAGTVYRIGADGRYELLHAFDPASEGFGEPAAPVEASDGNLYGVTIAGGRFHAGTAYRMTPEGAVTTLHDFAPRDPADAREARAPLIQARDGLLYGVAQLGGAFDHGAVYRLGLDGRGFAVIHSFERQDGAFPQGALLLGGDGRLFGTLARAGVRGGGLVYAVSPP
jgi:uncharacterized repeat protein (TIGR03803 family)